MSSDRIREIEDRLENEDLTSHERDELKRELNQLRDQRDGGGVGAYRTLGIAVLAIAVVVGAGYGLASMGVIQFQVSDTPTGNAGGEPIDPTQISTEGEPVLGSSDAAVTVVAYEDFECPVCRQFENQVFGQLKSEYIDSGQVKVVWKDFPLSQMHPWAMTAATTQECVYRQDNDAFWEVKEKLFNNQGSLTTTNARSKIISWAGEAGVDESAVRSCLPHGNPASEVQEDISEGQSLGVRGTPTVFINGQRLRGLNRYNQYKQVIENELAQDG
jgi:protein-disulfide isomerase